MLDEEEGELWLPWSDAFPTIEGWYWSRMVGQDGTLSIDRRIIYCWPRERRIGLLSCDDRVSTTDWRWPLFRIRPGRVVSDTNGGTTPARFVPVDGALRSLLRIVPCSERYYEFVRRLRLDPQTQHGFLEHNDITPEQQRVYMSKHAHEHVVCLYGEIPVGYAGVVDGDIRFCVVPYYHGKGFGTFMLEWVRCQWPSATGQIKASNAGSIGAFRKVGIPFTIIEGHD